MEGVINKVCVTLDTAASPSQIWPLRVVGASVLLCIASEAIALVGLAYHSWMLSKESFIATASVLRLPGLPAANAKAIQASGVCLIRSAKIAAFSPFTSLLSKNKSAAFRQTARAIQLLPPLPPAKGNPLKRVVNLAKRGSNQVISHRWKIGAVALVGLGAVSAFYLIPSFIANFNRVSDADNEHNSFPADDREFGKAPSSFTEWIEEKVGPKKKPNLQSPGDRLWIKGQEICERVGGVFSGKPGRSFNCDITDDPSVDMAPSATFYKAAQEFAEFRRTNNESDRVSSMLEEFEEWITLFPNQPCRSGAERSNYLRFVQNYNWDTQKYLETSKACKVLATPSEFLKHDIGKGFSKSCSENFMKKSDIVLSVCKDLGGIQTKSSGWAEDTECKILTKPDSRLPLDTYYKKAQEVKKLFLRDWKQGCNLAMKEFASWLGGLPMEFAKSGEKHCESSFTLRDAWSDSVYQSNSCYSKIGRSFTRSANVNLGFFNINI